MSICLKMMQNTNGKVVVSGLCSYTEDKNPRVKEEVSRLNYIISKKAFSCFAFNYGMTVSGNKYFNCCIFKF